MKDEIKEILEFTETADYKRLSVDEIVILKDYITNLQEENEQTKLLKELYKLRNEKAIDKISKLKPFIPNEISSWLDELENILKGSDKK